MQRLVVAPHFKQKTMFLITFPPLSPDPGQFIWTTAIFLFVLIFLGRTAFKPIVNGLKKRENDIQEALDAAEKAKAEMANLQAENEKLLQEAREERTKIINEAKQAGENIVNDARNKAKSEANQIVESAQREIENQKKSAIEEVKKEVGAMAIGIAEQVLRENLKGKADQEALVNKLVQNMNQN
jgi:F-type H+-transporting ATPase subunit b